MILGNTIEVHCLLRRRKVIAERCRWRRARPAESKTANGERNSSSCCHWSVSRGTFCPKRWWPSSWNWPWRSKPSYWRGPYCWKLSKNNSSSIRQRPAINKSGMLLIISPFIYAIIAPILCALWPGTANNQSAKPWDDDRLACRHQEIIKRRALLLSGCSRLERASSLLIPLQEEEETYPCAGVGGWRNNLVWLCSQQVVLNWATIPGRPCRPRLCFEMISSLQVKQQNVKASRAQCGTHGTMGCWRRL